MKPNYVPLEDRVVISVIKETERVVSGIIVPVEQKDLPIIEGIVEAVGDGVRSRGESINMYLKPGQKVVIYNSGIKYDMDGKTYRVLRQEEVAFIVTE